MNKEKIDPEMKKKIDRLQSSLVTLRTVAGWKAEELSEKAGLTRQYYGELEKNGDKKLTVPLYYCFLYLFEQKASENENFKAVLEDCLYNDTISNQQCDELSKYIVEERKKKTKEDKIKSKVGIIVGVGAVAASVIAIIAAAIGRKR